MPGGKLTKKEGVLMDRIKKRKAILKKGSHKSYPIPENFYPEKTQEEKEEEKE